MRELDKARAYAESLIKNAPDPVFVSDLEARSCSQRCRVCPPRLSSGRADRAVAVPDHFARGERAFLAALPRGRGAGRHANRRLNPRSASGEVIPTTLNASALRDPDGQGDRRIGILRDMREYEQVVRDLEQSKSELQEKILDLEKFRGSGSSPPS